MTSERIDLPRRARSLVQRVRSQKHTTRENVRLYPAEFESPCESYLNKPLPPLPPLEFHASVGNNEQNSSNKPPAQRPGFTRVHTSASTVSSLHSMVQGLKRISFWGEARQQEWPARQGRRDAQYCDRSVQTSLTYAPDSPNPVIMDNGRQRSSDPEKDFQIDSASPTLSARLTRPSKRKGTSYSSHLPTSWPHRSNSPASSGPDQERAIFASESSDSATPSTVRRLRTERISTDSVGTYESRYSTPGRNGFPSSPKRPHLLHQPVSDFVLNRGRQRRAKHYLSNHLPLTPETGLSSEIPDGSEEHHQHPQARTDVGIGGPHYSNRRRQWNRSHSGSVRPGSRLAVNGKRTTFPPPSPKIFRRPVDSYFADAVVIDDIPDHLQSSPLCPLNPKHKLGGNNWCPLHGGPSLDTEDSSKETEQTSTIRYSAPAALRCDSSRAAAAQERESAKRETISSNFSFDQASGHDADSPSCPLNSGYGGRAVCVHHGRKNRKNKDKSDI